MPEDVRKSIEALDQEFARFVNAKNSDRIAEMYTEDAILLLPHQAPIRGRAAIGAFWKGAVQAGLGNVRLTTVRVDHSEDLAVDLGQYQMNVPLPTGATRADRGNYVVEYRRQRDGSWKLQTDTAISELPP